jgi:hypothetical protein
MMMQVIQAMQRTDSTITCHAAVCSSCCHQIVIVNSSSLDRRWRRPSAVMLLSAPHRLSSDRHCQFEFSRPQMEATPLFQRTINRLDARHMLPLNDESACAPVAALLKANPLLSALPAVVGFTKDLSYYAIEADPFKACGIYARMARIKTSELNAVIVAVLFSKPSDRPDIDPKLDDFLVGRKNILTMLKHIRRG